MPTSKQLSPAERVITEIEEQSRALSEHVISGACADFEEYRYTTGKLEGLEAARRLLNDVLLADEEE